MGNRSSSKTSTASAIRLGQWLVADQTSPSGQAIRREQERSLDRAMRRLPELKHRCWSSAGCNGAPHEEVAAGSGGPYPRSGGCFAGPWNGWPRPWLCGGSPRRPRQSLSSTRYKRRGTDTGDNSMNLVAASASEPPAGLSRLVEDCFEEWEAADPGGRASLLEKWRRLYPEQYQELETIFADLVEMNCNGNDARADLNRTPEPVRSPRFVLTRRHKEGGLGAVFEAYDIELGRGVAVKEIKDEFADNPVDRAGSSARPRSQVSWSTLGSFRSTDSAGTRTNDFTTPCGSSRARASRKRSIDTTTQASAGLRGRNAGWRSARCCGVSWTFVHHRVCPQPGCDPPRSQAVEHPARSLRRNSGRRLGLGQGDPP